MSNMDSKSEEKLLDLLDAIGAESVLNIKRILESSNKVASGMLLRSIDYALTMDGGKWGMTILAENYWYWINYGRNANSKAPPVAVIERWIEQKGIPLVDRTTGRPIKLKSLAFIIARSIGQKGWQPASTIGTPNAAANFLEQTIATINQTFAEDLKTQWGDEYEKEIERMFLSAKKRFEADVKK
jgi:hypothetical protein